MNVIKSILYLCMVLLLASCQSENQIDIQQVGDHLFDTGWRFKKGDITDAEKVNFDDSDWRELSIPHDWNIEPHAVQDEMHIGPFVKGTKDSTSTGNIIGGTGWYRKHFVIDAFDKRKTVFLCFDGVSVQSDVWINGHHVGFHPNGYTPFFYDITPYLYPKNKENVVAVKTVNTGDNSRWYAGAGIYRHVWLSVSQSVAIEPLGVFVTTPKVDTLQSMVDVEIPIRNELGRDIGVQINVDLYDQIGQMVASKEVKSNCLSGCTIKPLLSLLIDNPKLWSPDSPTLYAARVRVLADGKPADVQSIRFGIRSIEFSAEKGFLLNGKETLLKGACVHHDNGLLGSAAFDKAEYRRVELLKKNGFNALRAAHNLPSSQFLDACDSLGILVINEVFDMWIHPKRDNDYHLYFEEWSDRDVAAMVMRDRNHPSVIVWSIGNEIYERADSSGLAIAERLVAVAKSLDTTRPVTQAICALWQNPSQHWDATIPVFALLDVGCYNYEWKHYKRDHQLHPERVMIGTESFPREALTNWQIAKKEPYVIGDFVWTGIDYIGEVGIGNTHYGKVDDAPIPVRPWPWYLSWCGDIDICGNKKPQSYYRDVVWGESNLELLVHAPVPEGQVELISKWGWPDEYPHWNWDGNENRPLQVSVYANYDSVQLFLNGKLIGEKVIRKTDLTAVFMVPFEAGELKAIGIRNGEEVVSKSLISSGKPAKIRLVAEHSVVKANPNDLSYIQIEVIDEEGRLVPDAELDIELSVSGSGKLIACGNAAPHDLASFNNPFLQTFKGKALAILQPGTEAGSIQLLVSSKGLAEERIDIQVK